MKIDDNVIQLRSAIANDFLIEPRCVLGFKRVLFTVFLYSILIFSLAGSAYTAYKSLPLFIFGLALCYFLENIMFMLGHIAFHADFIEIPEKNMGILVHHSFIHHYRNTRVYHERWLETRLSYIFDPVDHFKSFTTWTNFISEVGVAIILYCIDPLLGISALSFMWITRLLQSVCHEWYHNNKRETFYTKPIYYLMVFFEKIGLMSTKNHKRHHQHNLKSLNKASVWLDLYMPFGSTLEKIGDLIWEKALLRYQPQKLNMVKYVLGITLICFIIQYVIILFGFIFIRYLFP